MRPYQPWLLMVFPFWGHALGSFGNDAVYQPWLLIGTPFPEMADVSVRYVMQ
jgi:hypothetical protein